MKSPCATQSFSPGEDWDPDVTQRCHPQIRMRNPDCYFQIHCWFAIVQLLSHVWLFATAWTAACQPFLSCTICLSLLKFMSIESVLLSNHLILSHLLLLCFLSFPASGSFPMSQFLASGGQEASTKSISPSNCCFGVCGYQWYLFPNTVLIMSLLSLIVYLIPILIGQCKHFSVTFKTLFDPGPCSLIALFLPLLAFPLKSTLLSPGISHTLWYFWLLVFAQTISV